jgi:hypothetical protein
VGEKEYEEIVRKRRDGWRRRWTWNEQKILRTKPNITHEEAILYIPPKCWYLKTEAVCVL